MPKQVDRDAVALIRSKMSRLVTMEHYDETMRDTGLRYSLGRTYNQVQLIIFRRMKTKLEVRVPCYTGLPKSLASQKLHPSGMRYTRREVFRLSNKVVDNQVVTECYIQSRRANQDTKQSFGDNDSLDDLGSSISISLLRVKLITLTDGFN